MKEYTFNYRYFKDAEGVRHTLCVENYKKRKKYYLINNKEEMFPIPPVSHIKYDRESNTLFMTDEVQVFDDYTCHISFFMDLEGNVVGQGFCDYDGRLLDIVLHEFDEPIPFLGYEGFKMRLKVAIAKELYRNNGDLSDGHKRMLRTLQNNK